VLYLIKAMGWVSVAGGLAIWWAMLTGILAGKIDATPKVAIHVAEPVVVVDQHGNAVPVDQGQKINTSPNGDFQQVIGTDGKPTGDRLDRVGHPGQRDPSTQKPHGHRPGVTTSDGNPHYQLSLRYSNDA
jgi:hypothetical protein